MIKKILVLTGTFFLIIFYQNCSPFESMMSENSKSTLNYSGGSGNTYDGKLVINAPDQMKQGETVRVEVTGGLPPYELQANSSEVVVVDQGDGRYDLTLPADSRLSQVTLEAIDQLQDRVFTVIQVIGIDQWYYQDPKGIRVDEDGNIFFVEAKAKKIIHLAPSGKEINAWHVSEGEAPSDGNPTDLVLLEDQIYVSDPVKGAVLIFSKEGSFIRKIADSTELNWSECGGPSNLAEVESSRLFAVCGNGQKAYLFDLAGRVIKAFDFQSEYQSNGSLLTAIAVNQDGEAYFAFTGGRYKVFDLSGSFLRSFNFYLESSNISYRNKPVDIEFDDQNRLLIVNQYLRHLYRIQDDGATYEVLVTSGTSLSQIYKPFALAVDPEGNIFVTDLRTDRIQIFDTKGKYLYHFGSSGDLDGQLYFPMALKLLNNGHLAVLEEGNGRFSVFDDSGSLTSIYNPSNNWWAPVSFDISENGDILVANTNKLRVDLISDDQLQLLTGETGKFQHPNGVLFGPDNRIYVSAGLDRLEVLDSDGSFLFKIGSFGTGPGQYRRPRGLRIYNDKLYVADNENHRIQVFDLQGNHLQIIKNVPSPFPPMRNPYAVAMDSAGRLYVADAGNHRIVVFGQSGEFLGTFGSNGTQKGEFFFPTDVLIGDNGLIYVCDYGNHRVQIIEPATIPFLE